MRREVSCCRIVNILIVIIVLFLFSLRVNAEEKKQKKSTIAIMNFKTNNCPNSLGKTFSEILAGKIFNTNQFILLERNQMELVIKEKNLKAEFINSADNASSLGEILKVEKIAYGSISKVEDLYLLSIRIVDVKSKQVEISLSKEVKSLTELKEELNVSTKKIKNYYLGYKDISGKYDFYMAPGYLYGMGDFTQGARHGYGFNLGFTFNEPFNFKFPITVASGFYNFKPEIDSIDSMQMIPLIIGCPYYIDLTENVKLIPFLGAGYLFSRVNNDKVAYRADGNYQYKTEYFYNPMLSARLEINFLFQHRYYILAAPYYNLFFESGRIGQITGIDLGMRILF